MAVACERSCLKIPDSSLRTERSDPYILELTGLIGDVLSPPLRARLVRPKSFQTT